MTHRVIQTDQAPAAVGPYSQGSQAGNLLYTAMQIALDPQTGAMVGTRAPDQARQCLSNVAAIVTAAGGRMEDVLKTTVYLTNIAAFGPVNEIYAEFFPGDPPARGVVEVTALPKAALVAVEAIAHIG